MNHSMVELNGVNPRLCLLPVSNLVLLMSVIVFHLAPSSITVGDSSDNISSGNAYIYIYIYI